ncbi:uncharacterized protein LOC126088347 [Schistocerca cancellata]|uniref:uncharacterized protein LOC126088347 n=1 Tax=Schistocerca cancellata TaxID=274614 RepID=UPI0021189EFD|nr:uncharacterized protein LOC126088347 [Schistocerca cancellata]
MPRLVTGNVATEKVIAEVNKYSFLYTRDAEYKNILKKAETWRDIAKKLNEDPETVKVKWNNCRDAYLKHKKSVKGATGQSVTMYKSWPYSKNMKFMDRILEARLAKSNDSPSSDSESRSEGRTAPKPLSSAGSLSSDTEVPLQDDCAENILLPFTSWQMKLPSRKI